MNKTSFTLRFLSVAALVSVLVACNRTDDPQPTGPYTNGVFVINAGNFFDNNGSLSWLTRESRTAETDIFQVRNRRPLTGGVTDYVEAGNRGVILVDNSSTGLDKIEIVTTDSLRSVKTLSAPDIENPRYAVRISDTKVYVSCWGTTGTYPNFYVNPGYIAVIDLLTNSVKKIAVQKGAENLVVVGTEAFVSGVGGENILQVIDTQTDAVKTSIKLDGASDGLQRDANNKIWTFIGQKAVRINPTSKSVEAQIQVGSDALKSPGNLTPSVDGQSFYYTYTFYDAADNYIQKGELYRFAITDTAIKTDTPLAKRVFSGLGFDSRTNVLYAGFTPSYKQAGIVYRYQPTGQLIDSVQVEIAPTRFYFK